jgi:hypothetical protein
VRRSSLLVLACFVISQSAEAAGFERQERGIYSRSSVVHSPDVQAETASSESATTGRFERLDSTNAILLPSIATSTSWQGSSIALRSASARGGATSIVYVPEADRRAETPADSFFEVQFEAAEGEPFRLRGKVDALAFAAEAFAAVEIADLDDGRVVFEAEAGPGEHQSFDELGTLPAGRYRLTAFALSYGEVAGELRQPRGALPQPASLASFEAVLFVPEPDVTIAGRLVLAVLGVWACCLRRRRVPSGSR